MPLHRHLADPGAQRNLLGYYGGCQFTTPLGFVLKPMQKYNQTLVCSLGFRACDQELDKARCEQMDVCF